jgi:hypothetical protein
VLALSVFIGCQSVNLVDPTGTPISDGKIVITATNLYKSAAVIDTFATEKFLETTYQASAKGLTIVTWQWTFGENNSKYSTATVQFWSNLDPGAVTSVTVVGVDDKGTAHTATVFVKIVYSLDGMPGFDVITCTPVPNVDNLFNVVCVGNKKALVGFGGVAYGFTGNGVTPAWSVKRITADIDTNDNLISGILVSAGNNAGKFIVIRQTLSPGNYETHFGRVQSDSTLKWGTGWGRFPGGKFTITTTGSVVPGVSDTALPGQSGNAFTRKTITDSSVIVYNLHVAKFTSGWIQLQDSTGVWYNASSTLNETMVTGFDHWGQIEIKFKQLLIKNCLIYRYGDDSSNLGSFSANMYKSDDYSSLVGGIRYTFIVPKLP